MARRTNKASTATTGRKASTTKASTTGKGAGSTAATASATTEAPKVPPVEPNAVAEAVAEATTEAPKVPLPKCAMARLQAGKPHPSLLQVIERKGEHPGKGARIKRWHLYSVGMSVLHCRVTEGLDHLDVLGYYVKNAGTDGKPLMSLRPMTDAERAEALARWEGKAVEAQAIIATASGDDANSGDDAGAAA